MADPDTTSSFTPSFSGPLRAPPLAAGLPLVGALPAVLRERLDFFATAREKYGDIFAVKLGPTKIIALTHPRYAQHVLRDHAKNYWKGGGLWEAFRTLLGNGIPVSDGAYWRRQRRMMQPQFHRDRLAALVDSMVDAAEEGMANWPAVAAAGEPFNIEPALSRLTMKVIVKTMFGSRLSLEEADFIAKHMTYVMDYIVRGVITTSLPRWLPFPGRERYQAALKAIDGVLFRIIERRHREQDLGGDLLSILLNTVDAETGERMTDTQLRDEVVSIFLGGYETTSLALAWTMHFCAQQPQVMQMLVTEVDAVLGGARPTFSDLQKLSNTLMIARETMRLRPPSYWIPRTALEDDVIDGFRISAGASLGVMTYAIHRHPEQWECPTEFDPTRFLPERSAGRHKLAWMPFGAGQRMCIGADFALFEAQVILSLIAQRYHVSAIAGRTASVQLSTTLKSKDGIWVRLRKR